MMAGFRWSHVNAGFIAVLVGYVSSAVIVVQAATAAGASTAQVASWLWALGLGMAATSIGLSLYYRAPVLTAWSTAGAALLATALHGVSLSDAVGVFVFSSRLLTVFGLLGWVDALLRWIPRAVAAAMLAGVLLRFGLQLFGILDQALPMVALMIAVWLLARLAWPNFAVLASLAAGIVWCAVSGEIQGAAIVFEWAQPVWVTPTFSWSAMIGIGLPLFLVTMASQNMPGLAVLRANGYDTPASPPVVVTGLTGVVLAPLGGFAFNLAAITAAICMSPDADPQPERRYRAAVWAGVFYAIAGLLGLTVVTAFASMPATLLAAMAGIALLATLSSSLATALEAPADRDAALLTFLCTASGITLLGIGSAFWGLVLGVAAAAVARGRRV
jgi:benzoate membrane transport protein